MAELVDWLHHESVTYGNGFAIKSETDFANCTGKITAVKIKTNADRIRSMTDEELAKAWWKYMDCGECPVGLGCNMTERDCEHWVLDWLKKDADLD